MTRVPPAARRLVLKRLAQGLALVPLAAVLPRLAAAAPLVAANSPEAKAVQYTEDAATAKAAKGNTCATCALYQGANGSTQGPCQLFSDKDVKAAGWCSSWAPQM